MLSSALGALGDRVDSKFLTAYWLPAFDFALGGLGILGLLVGPGQVDAWVDETGPGPRVAPADRCDGAPAGRQLAAA